MFSTQRDSRPPKRYDLHKNPSQNLCSKNAKRLKQWWPSRATPVSHRLRPSLRRNLNKRVPASACFARSLTEPGSGPTGWKTGPGLRPDNNATATTDLLVPAMQTLPFSKGEEDGFGKEGEGTVASFPREGFKGGALALPFGWGCLRGRGFALLPHGESVERGPVPLSSAAPAGRSGRRCSHRQGKSGRRPTPPAARCRQPSQAHIASSDSGSSSSPRVSQAGSVV
jgi:hypothetical protein